MSKHRIENAAQTYKKKYYGLKSNAGQFFIEDYMEVINLATIPGRDPLGNMLDAVEMALQGGFIIGYRKAQRDYRAQK